MTCETCGEKPKKCGNCNKDFPRAVIELNNPETLVLLRKVVIPASMGTEEQVPAAIGKYHNVILKYEANKHVYLYSSDGIPTLLEMDVPQEIIDRIDTLEEGVNDLNDDVDDLNDAIDDVEQEIEELKNSPDVVDIVATYADLQSYDTSSLGDKDVIRVLTDETHDDESSYYRWSTATQTWTFIGATGPYYTKSETDSKIEVNRGLAHILTSEDYNWNSTSSSTTEPYDSIALWLLPSGQYQINDNLAKVFTSAAATELIHPNQHMYLINKEPTANASILVTPYSAAAVNTKITLYVTAVANGQPSGGTTVNGMTIPWGDIPTVVQNTGDSTTNVMSQDATTAMIFAHPGVTDSDITIGDNISKSSIFSRHDCVVIGNDAYDGSTNKSAGYSQIYIGNNAGNGTKTNRERNSGRSNIAIGTSATAFHSLNQLSEHGQISIGETAYTTNSFSVAIGSNSLAEDGGIAIGAYANSTTMGEVNIGTTQTSTGYNTSNYRLLTGLYDPVNAHDAATKGYVDTNSVASATFWGQSVNNGAVNGSLIFEGNPATDGTDITLESDGSLTIHTGSGGWVTFHKSNGLSNDVNFGMASLVDIADGTGDTYAVNVRQLNKTLLVNGTTAPDSSTVGKVGSLCSYVTNGTGHIAICTAVNSGNPLTYTWQTLI